LGRTAAASRRRDPRFRNQRAGGVQGSRAARVVTVRTVRRAERKNKQKSPPERQPDCSGRCRGNRTRAAWGFLGLGGSDGWRPRQKTLPPRTPALPTLNRPGGVVVETGSLRARRPPRRLSPFLEALPPRSSEDAQPRRISASSARRAPSSSARAATPREIAAR
jgi:hypothetical protein